MTADNKVVTLLPVRRKEPPKRKKPPTPKDSLEVWVSWVEEAWRHSVESILETGRRLIALRDQANYGEWMKAVEQRMKLSQRSVNMLIAIAECKVIADWKHASNLPPSWATLYEMTRLPGDTLREKLEKGEINSETERSEVTKMKGSSSARAPACKDPWEKVLTKIDAFIKEVTTKAKADGLTALEMAEVTANKEEIVKRLNALIVNLKHFEKKGK